MESKPPNRRRLRPPGALEVWCCALVVTFCVLPEPLAAEPPVELSLLTYNVHGLAPLPSGGYWGTNRMQLIRRALERYDVVLLQEDFEYSKVLSKGAHGRVHRGPGRRWRWGHLVSAPLWVTCWLTMVCGNPPILGSGLTAQVRSERIPEFEPLVARSYDRCRGYLASGLDCYAAKGFTGTRLHLQGSMVVDVYNTHLEAGNGRRDLEVRQTQIRELARAVETHSHDAVIVAGDFNSNLDGGDRGDDFEPVETLLAALRMRDAGARPDPAREWVTMDYILYRSGPSTRLALSLPAHKARAAEHDACGTGTRVAGEDVCFVNRRGRSLSDHPALFAHFKAWRGRDVAEPGDGQRAAASGG